MKLPKQGAGRASELCVRLVHASMGWNKQLKPFQDKDERTKLKDKGKGHGALEQEVTYEAEEAAEVEEAAKMKEAAEGEVAEMEAGVVGEAAGVEEAANMKEAAEMEAAEGEVAEAGEAAEVEAGVVEEATEPDNSAPADFYDVMQGILAEFERL